MNILSLFDGMSCGQIALKELGIIPEVYYASEIDKHAIAQTQLNFPNTIQLGSVVDVDVSKLEQIDLLIGGSPCQSFSFAGKRKGMATKCDIEIYTLERYLKLKEDGFEFEGQSYLFWEYMRILTDIRKYNPDVKFLLENVEMGAKWERVLSEAIGVYGVHINSALVSAQNRKRIYWTNIRTRKDGLFGELYSDIHQPADRCILLRDILESEVNEKYFLSDKMISSFVKKTKFFKESGGGFAFKPSFDGNHKARTVTQKAGNRMDDNFVCTSCDFRYNAGFRLKQDGKIGTLLARARNDESCVQLVYIEQRSRGFNNGGIHESKSPVLTANSWEQNNVLVQLNKRQQKNYKEESEKADTFLSTSWKGSQANGMTLVGNSRIRRLTPTECARLQTIPEWYTWNCSDTQQYRMLGNGWTIEVIKHIFSHLTKITNIK